MNIQKALVVDDSKVAHLTLRKLLMERGIEVDWVGSGEDAVNYLNGQQPHIIFMDVMMPGMDGFETTRAITGNAAGNAPPIIMCSANATDADKQNARDSGAFGFLSKPYTPAQLDQILADVRSAVAPAAEAPAAPATEQPRVEPTPQPPLEEPATAPPTFDMATIERIAEARAQAAAAQTAREIALEAARSSTAESVQKFMEEAEQRVLQSAVQAAREAAESAAASARDEAEQASRAAAEETARMVAEEAGRAVAEQAARSVSESVALEAITQSRPSLVKSLEEPVAQQIRDGLTQSMQSPELKTQLEKMTRDAVAAALPGVESTARQAAVQAAQESLPPPPVIDETLPNKALKQANLALIVGIVALVAAIGLFAATFFLQ